MSKVKYQLIKFTVPQAGAVVNINANSDRLYKRITGFFASVASSPVKSFDGLGRPIAFKIPSSSTATHGPACPSFGAGPIDLVTTPPAPIRSIRDRDAPVVPSTPAASSRWFSSATPPTVTGPGLITTMDQEMVVIYY